MKLKYLRDDLNMRGLSTEGENMEIVASINKVMYYKFVICIYK